MRHWNVLLDSQRLAKVRIKATVPNTAWGGSRWGREHISTWPSIQAVSLLPLHVTACPPCMALPITQISGVGLVAADSDATTSGCCYGLLNTDCVLGIALYKCVASFNHDNLMRLALLSLYRCNCWSTEGLNNTLQIVKLESRDSRSVWLRNHCSGLRTCL